ncbi:MAG: hypothetical protein ACFFCX_16380 [Candidatus Sifarchaeia archaeon]
MMQLRATHSFLFVFVALLILSLATTTTPDAYLDNDFISMTRHPESQKVLSEDGLTRSWHDDCSNLSTFVGQGDNSWPHNSDVSVTFGSVQSSGTYYYSDDVGTGSGHHGPLLYHTLSDNFTLGQFNELRVEFEMDALGADRRGWIRVGLHAPDNATILTLQLADPWTGTAGTYVQGVYKFANGTTTDTGQTPPDPQPFHKSIALFSKTSGIYTSFPGETNSCLIERSQIEGSRIIKYISIQFNGYDSGVLCETMRIHDIKLNYYRDGVLVHDCSSMDGFDGYGTDDWTLRFGSYQEEAIFGNLASNGTMIYATDVGSGLNYHGPLRYLTLDTPFSLQGLIEFNARVRMSTNQIGKIHLVLNDEYGNSIVGLVVRDSWSGPGGVTTQAAWKFSNGSESVIANDPVVGPYDETVRIFQNTTGIYADLPRFGISKLIGHNDVNTTRLVSYISIHFMGWSITPPCDEMDIYNIQLKWNTAFNVASPPDYISPSIDYPSDISYEEGTTGNSVRWNPSDQSPDTYEVLRDAVSIVPLTSWDGTSIQLSVDGLSLGRHNYTLIVHDQFGRSTNRTVFVDVVDTTNPSFDVSPEDFTYEPGVTGHGISWNPADTNPQSYTIYLGGTPIRSGAWNSSAETITISVDGHGPGEYNYTLEVTDVSGNTASDVVLVTVAYSPPTIDSPADIVYDEFTTGHSITWNPADENPQSYTIYLEGVPIRSGAWNSSVETITISVDGHDPGEYNYTLMVADVSGNSTSDVVLVTVEDGTLPVIDSPADVQYDEFTSGHSITWDPTDAHPQSYTIYLEGTPIRSGAWNSSAEVISIVVDGLSIGTFSYTLMVTDIGGNTRLDEVIVTVVDGSLPVLDSPADIQYNEFSTGYSITWDPTDAHPQSYTIYLEGTPIKSGTWNSSSETITVSVDGHGFGTYGYTLMVTDIGGNTRLDEVIVTVVDGSLPVLDNPVDIQYNEFSTGHSITWDPTDAHPQSYTIYLEGAPIQSGAWNSSSETITISVDGHGLGEYNYTLVVTDIGGNPAADVVIVTVVDGTLPALDSPSDFQYNEFSTGNLITWDPSDLHPVSYIIYLEGSPVKSGAWNSSIETVSISVDGHGLGTYNYTLVVTDVGGNTASDEVMVYVVDATSPIIDSPSDLTYYEFDTGYSITWNPDDANPQSYFIYRNEVLIKSGPWNSSSETITISVDGLALGIYNYTILVVDLEDHSVSDEVIVTVSDGTLPTIDMPLDIEYFEGLIYYLLNWTPSDPHPDRYEIYKDGLLATTGMWNSSGEVISFQVGNLSYGTYTFLIFVFDVGGNNASDSVLVTVSDATPPVLDSPLDIEYNEGAITNTINWTPSDLNPASYEIYKDELLVASGSWNSSGETISHLVDGLSLGNYTYLLIVFDLGGNNATDTVFVLVVDGTVPIIDSPPDIEYIEGSLDESINWTPSDLHPDRYEIYRNGSLVDSGPWDGSAIEINVGGLAPGTYEYMLSVWDIGDNSASDIILVKVTEDSTSSITATTSATIPTNGTFTLPNGFTMITIIISGGSVIIIIIIIIAIIKKKGK